jgi:hypothetical protein
VQGRSFSAHSNPKQILNEYDRCIDPSRKPYYFKQHKQNMARGLYKNKKNLKNIEFLEKYMPWKLLKPCKYGAPGRCCFCKKPGFVPCGRQNPLECCKIK